MATTTLTSELEAVNTILQAGGEAPVSSLSTTGLLHLDRAKAQLDETSRLVQGRGWNFNTDVDYELAIDVNGAIALPADTLQFDAYDEFNDRYRPVARGLRLYNGKDHTFIFPANIKGDLIRLLPWDDLPQPIRYLVAISAALVFQKRSEKSVEGAKFTEADLEQAKIAASQYERDVEDANVLTDNLSSYAVIGYGERDFFPTY